MLARRMQYCFANQPMIKYKNAYDFLFLSTKYHSEALSSYSLDKNDSVGYYCQRKPDIR